jgi:hypothetical protein
MILPLLLAAVASVEAAEAPEIAEGPRWKDKALGYELRLFADTAALPPRKTVKFVDADLAWYEAQVLRSWVVQRGGRRHAERLRVLLGKLCARYGDPVTEPGKEDPSKDWSADEIKTWVERFSEMSAKGPEWDPKIPQRKARAWELVSKTREGFAFLLRRKDKASYILLYKAPSGWNLKEKILGSARSFRFISPGRAKAVELKPPGRKKLDPALEPARKASIERVTRSIQGLESWWWQALNHFVVASNVDAKTNRGPVLEALANLENISRAYRAVLPGKEPVKAVSVVKLFSHRDQIFAHFSERQPKAVNAGLIGMWVNVYDELVLTLDPAKIRNSMTTLYHEGFHQYLFYASGSDLDPPRWFDEGTADYFGGAVFEKDAVRFVENPSRKNTITKIVNGEFTKRYQWTPPPLETMVQWTRAEFYGNVKWLVFRYTLAWSLVYYLRAGIEEGSPYAGLLDTYFKTLLATKSASKAYTASFGKVDMAKLQKDWKAFWLDPAARKKAAARKISLKE